MTPHPTAPPPKGKPHPTAPRSQTQPQVMPSAISQGANSAVLGLRCYGSLGRQSVGRWVRIAPDGVTQCKTVGASLSQFECFRMFLDAKGRKRTGASSLHEGLPPGWVQTDHECAYDQAHQAWAPAVARGSYKPGLTSVHINDTISFVVDSTAGGAGSHRSTLLQLTYLQSYDEVGVLHVECVTGCTCSAATIDTLLPSAKYAALHRSNVRVSQASRCEVRLTNVGRPARHHSRCPSTGSPCTKVKLAGLSVVEESGSPQ